jgi:GT2 family glycosyltransferase
LDIIIPFFEHEDLVPVIVASLLRVKDEIRSLGVSVVAVNDSPYHEPLGRALEDARSKVDCAFPFSIRTNPRNLGFVQSCNAAMAESVEAGRDIILLNSDTIVFSGALTALVDTANADPMIAFVSPRSNNATICNLPHDNDYRAMPPEVSFAAFQKLSPLVPAFDYVPTVVGFCLYMRAKVLSEIGLFDAIYSPGYNEENDLIRRANRFGYCAAIANRGFVWHACSASFASAKREELNRHNAKVLDSRYPEYEILRERYLRSPSYRAEALLSGLLPGDQGRFDIAFDFSHFGCHYNGTFEAGIGLLQAICKSFANEFNFFVLARDDVAQFHGLDEIPNLKVLHPTTQRLFAVCLSIGQPFLVDDLIRLNRRAPLVAAMMLDTIAMDCGYIEPQRDLLTLWQCVFDHFDGIAFESKFTEEQYRRRFAIPPSLQLLTTPLSLRLSEYRRKSSAANGERKVQPGFWFVIGNHFEHKAIVPTMTALRQEFPEQRMVVLGTDKNLPEGVVGYSAGHLSEELIESLYDDCDFVIFPSHYEGYGFPILKTLALGKPILSRNAPATVEMFELLGRDPNIHMFDNTRDLIDRLRSNPPHWQHGSAEVAYGWAESAAELAGLYRRMLQAGTNRERISRRLAAVDRLATSASPHSPSPVLPQNALIEELLIWVTRHPRLRATLRPFWRLFRRLLAQ